MATERRTDTSKQIPTNWYMTGGGLLIDILVQVNKSDCGVVFGLHVCVSGDHLTAIDTVFSWEHELVYH